MTAASTGWSRSSFCRPESPCCVEVAGDGNGNVLVRRDAAGPVLAFTSPEWTAFLDGARKGEFDSFAAGGYGGGGNRG